MSSVPCCLKVGSDPCSNVLFQSVLFCLSNLSFHLFPLFYFLTFWLLFRWVTMVISCSMMRNFLLFPELYFPVGQDLCLPPFSPEDCPHGCHVIIMRLSPLGQLCPDVVCFVGLDLGRYLWVWGWLPRSFPIVFEMNLFSLPSCNLRVCRVLSTFFITVGWSRGCSSAEGAGGLCHDAGAPPPRLRWCKGSLLEFSSLVVG